MDRTIARIAEDFIKSTLTGAFDRHPALKDYNINFTGGRIGVTDLTVGILITPKNAAKSLGIQVTDQSLRAGLAPPGTRIVSPGNKKGTILKRRTKKYLFREDETGKEWVANFQHFRLLEEPKAAEVGST